MLIWSLLPDTYAKDSMSPQFHANQHASIICRDFGTGLHESSDDYNYAHMQI